MTGDVQITNEANVGATELAAYGGESATNGDGGEAVFTAANATIVNASANASHNDVAAGAKGGKSIFQGDAGHA